MYGVKMKLRQYQRAIDESNIVSKTDINGVITFVNDEFCKISGYTKE
ncbi:PAS domain S-box protein, partial [Campylobacter sp.]